MMNYIEVLKKSLKKDNLNMSLINRIFYIQLHRMGRLLLVCSTLVVLPGELHPQTNPPMPVRTKMKRVNDLLKNVGKKEDY